MGAPGDDQRPHRPIGSALVALSRCVLATVGLLARRELRQPTDRLGATLGFADGTTGQVYRETVVGVTSVTEPVLLVVAFRLRGVRGWGHAAFRVESVLNTPLFAGFPGFVSKLWLTHDEHGRYRGVYQWDGAARAHAYVGALWWPLALVSHRDSIRHVVLAGRRRDEVLADPTLLDGAAPSDVDAWWRLVSVAP